MQLIHRRRLAAAAATAAACCCWAATLALASSSSSSVDAPAVAPVAPRMHKFLRSPSHQRLAQQQQQHEQLSPRQAPAGEMELPGFPPNDAQQAVVTTDAAQGNYVQAAQAVSALPSIKGGVNGNLEFVPGQVPAADGLQWPWNQALGNVTASAAVNGSQDAGWQQLPDVPGFVLNTSLPVFNRYKNESGIIPFYIAVNNPQTVKRFIVVLPGKPRDVWKYANLMLNARNIPVRSGSAPWNTWGITNDTVGIVAPAFLNTNDQAAGSCLATWLCFNKATWQQGSSSQNPKMKHSVTSYDALDAILDQLFDKNQYPALNNVVVAGHSLGGQGVQRYAVMKKTRAYDDNVRYWVANPGSWVWLSDKRPYQPNQTCASTMDTWPYGIHQNTSHITKYARKDAEHDGGAELIARFQRRRVTYALAMFDLGGGDTHCQAQWQGASHLDRGTQFVLSMGNDLPGGFPKTHVADFIANAAHMDYAMYSANLSLQRLFYDDLNTRYPDVTNLSNPGDRPRPFHTPTNGTHAFATPAHERMAEGLLGGSIGVTIAIFFLLPTLFRNNYDQSWEKAAWR